MAGNGSWVTRTQAEQAFGQLEGPLRNCVAQLEKTNTDFVEAMSHTWADNNAKTYMDKHKEIFLKMIKDMNENVKVFRDTMKEVVHKYVQQGNMGSEDEFQKEAFQLNGTFEVSFSPYLQGAETSDTYGYKPDNEPEIFKAHNTMIEKCNEAREEIDRAMRKINAFGKTDIIQSLATSSGGILKILENALKRDVDEIHKGIDAVRESYEATDAAANEKATIQVHEEG